MSVPSYPAQSPLAYMLSICCEGGKRGSALKGRAQLASNTHSSERKGKPVHQLSANAFVITITHTSPGLRAD